MMTYHENEQNTSDFDLRETILRYLKDCPNAADTVEGVVSWWLPRQHYNDSYKNVARIMEKLVDENILIKNELPDGKVIYTCNNNDTNR